MSIGESRPGFTDRGSPSASTAGGSGARDDQPSPDTQARSLPSWQPPRPEPELVRRLKSRVVRSELRNRLRARPHIQGKVLAPAGVFRRLPRTPALYFPFYHDVPSGYAGQLRRHLRAFAEQGPLISFDDAIDVLAGDRALDGPQFCLSFDDGHWTWVDVLLPLLSELRVTATFYIRTDVVAAGTELSWQGCRELLAAGMRIGSHTRTHRRLRELDDADAAAEISGSKAEIEDRLGTPVPDFAAPYGWPHRDFDQRHIDMAQRAGYRSFASTLRTAMHPGDSPLFIHRQGLHPAWPLRAVMTRVHE